MEKFRIENILNIEKIENEFELEQANSLFKKLRLLKEDSSLKTVRKHIANLIEAYEAKHWSNEEKVTDEQILASEDAEKIIQDQDKLINKRKELIKAVLKENNLLQNDLAKILDHRKNYMSELINGVRPFSQEDIIIINKVLGIALNDLIIPIVKDETTQRISKTLKELNLTNLSYIRENDNQNFFMYTLEKLKESGLLQINNDYQKAFEIFLRKKENRNLISI